MRVKICQSVQYAFCYFAKDLFAGAASQLLNLAIHCIKRSALAELHGDADGTSAVVDKGSVVPADVITCAILVERKLSDDLLLHVWVGICGDDL